MTGYTIGELSRATGVHVETIRYYQRLGLLPVPPRDRGPRRYGPEAVDRLLLIRHARHLTFSLAEVGGLLAASDDERCAAAVRDIAAARLAKVEREVGTLQEIARELAELVRQVETAGRSAARILQDLGRSARAES